MTDERFHPAHALLHHKCNAGVFQEALQYVMRTNGQLLPMEESQSDVHHICADAIWWHSGRPRWFITTKMYELLADCKCDDTSIVNVHVPHDVMYFCFAHGIIDRRSRPVRSVMLAWLRSDITRVLTELGGCPHPGVRANLATSCVWSVDHAWCGDESSRRLVETRRLEQCGGSPTTISADDEDYKNEAIRICYAALLYHAARPEAICIPCLDAQQRKVHDYHGQGAEHIYKILTPEVKWIQRVAPDLCTPAYTVKPHFRGWVLRTLRHQRYKRKPDGTCQVILIPPCAIHPEQMEQRT